MSDPTDDEADYLLSRGNLGGSQRERILATVLAASAERPRTVRARRWLWGGSGALALAAAVALFVWPRASDDRPSPFRAKGGAAGAPIVDALCLGATRRACPRGSLVAFEIEGGGESGFLTAHADPVAGGERIWYLVDEPVGAAVDGAATRTSAKAARVGDEHAPGRYRVDILFTRRPFARTAPAADDPDLIARASLELEVIP